VHELAVEADGHDVVTIERLSNDDPVVQAFACQCEPGHGTALQCGICTPEGGHDRQGVPE
jgi:aerobic-type carbon monoxide dehydrogenase small subunit (CoxS/CutS family)